MNHIWIVETSSDMFIDLPKWRPIFIYYKQETITGAINRTTETILGTHFTRKAARKAAKDMELNNRFNHLMPFYKYPLVRYRVRKYVDERNMYQIYNIKGCK